MVEQAAAQSLAAIAICDHDTADGLDEALSAGSALGVEVIPCVEISTTHEEKVEAHILGYFIDHHDAELREWLQTLKDARWDRGKRIVELLNAAGVPVSFGRVAEIAAGGAVGRPHVARAIVEIGRAPSIDAAFGRFLLDGAPCVAHVAKLKCDDLVRELIKDGLAAIEVFHPDHGSTSTRFYFGLAKKLGLIATGGSDAHGISGERGAVGCVTVGYHVVEDLRAVRG
jgi:predicted metal-dependent phosphoesterase TrpH